MDQDLLKKFAAYFAKEYEVKYAAMDELRREHPLPAMCRLLEVSTSGYYAWRKRSPSVRTQQEPRLEMEIRAAHRRTRETCGPERLQRDFADHAVVVGVHRIKRLREKLKLRCKQKRRFKATTDSRHILPIAPNLLNQDFACGAPNQVLSGDITYITTDEGWLYLAGLKDLFSGELVSYAMSERMIRHLVMRALFRAAATHRPSPDLIHHTDRGSPILCTGVSSVGAPVWHAGVNEPAWKLRR